MTFAINHICTPGLRLDGFFAMARRLGCDLVEIRNDIPDVIGSTSPQTVKAAAEAAGVTILSINALYPFNVPSDDLAARAMRMADYAKACGARALVMCPLNEGTPVPRADMVAALATLAPILRDRGLTGLVEPLGFPVSSLRRKADAIAAIEAADGADVFRLVHDTFHHHLAGEAEIFPDRTGLVHISGVVDPDVAVDDMRDGHRVLVDAGDRLGNLDQIRALREGGYEGPFSFEPFAQSFHDLSDPEAALRDSIAFIAAGLGRAKAAE
ncbi:TIM barrel protein [Fulvimarina sp. 2208YS6-2-32]|uniref:TIM barrel protein n=1 Tax=Fulvimarina uroteuthidis TaxID=3098149 RepID=A0ABU5I1C5_9HYPH|nr:TIM barrel protein [Fulvimarina sp. 2208YS6-2-32]MDY8109183.1 TIM barrel protein [Fulvimarina sp. 2208YS6-2-32]